MAAPTEEGPCSLTLVDSLGFNWDLNQHGAISEGSQPDLGLDDAFDTYGLLSISTDGGESFTEYVGPPGGGGEPTAAAATGPCLHEDGGREIAYPVDEIAGLEVSRKLYVPAEGVAFARLLDVIRNPGEQPVTVTRRFDGDVGSDSATIVTAESNGDDVVDGADTWASTGGDPRDPRIGHVWDGSVEDGRRDDAEYAGFPPDRGGSDALTVEHADVVIAPGETAMFMHVVAQRGNNDPAASAAAALGGDCGAVLSGLDGAELSGVRNWAAGDCDGDGVQAASDNCPATANADQADLDGDGAGNACDPDTDGDGVSDVAEREIGLDPLRTDSDGDGVGDRTDQCPVRAGQAGDGCPAASVVVEERRSDDTPPLLGLTLPRAITLRTLLSGVNVGAICDEPCSLRARLLISERDLRGGRARSSGFNRTLARESVTLGGGERTLTVRPCERTSSATAQSRACLRRLRAALGSRGRFRVRLEVVARDAAGNDTRVTRTLTVR